MRSACFLALLLAAGCAAGKQEAAPTAPLVVGSGRAPDAVATPPVDARPAGVAAWLRAERADALVGLLGLGSSALATELAPVLASVDVGQAFDVILAAGPETRKLFDLVPVVRFHVRDTKTLIALAEKELDVREDGDRIYARPRGAAEDDHFACVLSHTDTAVCSTVEGVNRYGAWLADVQPPPGPTARLTIFGAPAARLLADDGDLGAFERDVETLTIDLDDERNGLPASGGGLRATLRLATRTSRLATELARATGPASGAFGFRGAAGSLSFPGGGALPVWARNGYRDPAASAEDVRNLAAAAFAKPVAIGAWVETDRARTALVAARRLPSRRTWLALAEALEPRYALAGDVPLAELAKAVRAMATAGATVRPAHSGVTGSFVYERTEGGDPPRRTAMLGTRIADRSWLVVAPTEEQAEELLKRTAVTPGADVPHLLLRGELPASLELERGLRQTLVHGPSADTLRRIETQLATIPRPVPFVISTEPTGAGLVVTATLEGRPDALWALVTGDAASTWAKATAYALVLH